MKKDIDNMQYLAENMLGRTFCPLGDAAAMPTIAFVKKFRKEFEDHLEGRPCPYEKEGAVRSNGIALSHWRSGHFAIELNSFRSQGFRSPDHAIAKSLILMADVTLTVDGKKVTAPAGTLLIEACKTVGIEVPSFCYYPNLSLQGACRMCLVKIEKMPKLQTACTTVISEGMIVTSDSEEIKQARKSMVEMLLGNHPLDCPVCDAGGECELQDMTFSYGAAESKFMEAKNHKDEQQWSPVVFFDRPRCILCYRCVRVCGEGMDVWALGVQNRGVSSIIAPNKEDHLECEECGMCIDICPVGALTSGAYRYKTRPWEMKHVGTICTHCGDGCKTTLGVRRADTGMEIVRGDNRDKSGTNGDFLCIKGRYAFDFANHEERLTQTADSQRRQADARDMGRSV